MGAGSKTVNPTSALAGTRVLEVCGTVAGPYCCRLLADFGAEVIKVEPPQGDQSRRLGPFRDNVSHPERSGLFFYLNMNKLGITLNLDCVTGREIFIEAIKQADVLVEDQAPGYLDKLGLGYETLRKLNSRLVMTSITPFGQTGPYKDYKAYPLNTFHGGGEGYLTPSRNPHPDWPPLKVGKYSGEYEAGIHAVLATMAAIFWQKKTGVGQHVDVSKQEALIAINLLDVGSYPAYGLLPNRNTRLHMVSGRTPCKDGYVQLDLYEEIEWQNFLRFVGNSEWLKMEMFTNNEKRRANAKQVEQLIEEWAKDHSKLEIYHEGQKAGVPTAMYATPKDIAESEQLNQRGFLKDLDHKEMGRVRFPTVPYRLSKTPCRYSRPAPMLGENNLEVYQRLGHTKEDICRLRGLGVI